MGRTLSILLVLVGCTFIAPPAHAALSVTISVSQTTVSEGDFVVFSGKALGAKPRSVVELQRKTDAGWETVKTRTLGSTREYRFKATPPRGDQKYRVFKPGQLGQAAASSPRIQLTVQWTPSITVEATRDDQYYVDVSGTATGLPEDTIVRRQFRNGGDWRYEGPADSADGTNSQMARVAADGTFHDRFYVTMHRTYRYTIEEEGPRREGSSNEFEFTTLPNIDLELGRTTNVDFPAGATERTLRMHLGAGQTFTYHGPYWAQVSMVDPSGAEMPGFGPDAPARCGEPSWPCVVTGEAPWTGEYAITLRRTRASVLTTAVITLSEPIRIATSVDAPGREITSTLPGQVADLVFAAEGGSLLSEYSAALGRGSSTATLLDPSGGVVGAWRGRYNLGSAWRLPAVSGEYTLRLVPSSQTEYRLDRPDQAVLSGRETTMTVDGAAAHVSLDRPGRIGEVSVTVPAGLDMRISDTGPVHLDEVLIDPDGQALSTVSASPQVPETKAGTYTTFVSYDAGPAAFDYYASTPATYDLAIGSPVDFNLGPAPGRNALIRIPVSAGAMFSFEAVEADRGFCRPWASVESGSELLSWQTSSNHGGHPPVFNVSEPGELVLRTSSCTGEGTFRLVPTSVVQSVETGSTTDQWGDTTTTSTATLEATVPGQVMILDYDAGTYPLNNIDIWSVGSSIDDQARLTVSYGDPGANSREVGASGGAPDTLSTRLYNEVGSTYLYLYAGPTATGTLDLRISRLDY
jgi:hypothetical protein